MLPSWRTAKILRYHVRRIPDNPQLNRTRASQKNVMLLVLRSTTSSVKVPLCQLISFVAEHASEVHACLVPSNHGTLSISPSNLDVLR